MDFNNVGIIFGLFESMYNILFCSYLLYLSLNNNLFEDIKRFII